MYICMYIMYVLNGCIFAPLRLMKLCFIARSTQDGTKEISSCSLSPKRENKTHPNTKHSLLGVAESSFTSIFPNHMLLHDLHHFTEHNHKLG